MFSWTGSRVFIFFTHGVMDFTVWSTVMSALGTLVLCLCGAEHISYGRLQAWVYYAEMTSLFLVSGNE